MSRVIDGRWRGWWGGRAAVNRVEIVRKLLYMRGG